MHDLARYRHAIDDRDGFARGIRDDVQRRLCHVGQAHHDDVDVVCQFVDATLLVLALATGVVVVVVLVVCPLAS